MNLIRGKCGTRCNDCNFKEKFNCQGCLEMKGKLFWGECDIYECATKKGYEHCGNCDRLPCEDLQTFIKEGHQSNRLENLIRWKNEEI